MRFLLGIFFLVSCASKQDNINHTNDSIRIWVATKDTAVLNYSIDIRNYNDTTRLDTGTINQHFGNELRMHALDIADTLNVFKEDDWVNGLYTTATFHRSVVYDTFLRLSLVNCNSIKDEYRKADSAINRMKELSKCLNNK